MFKGFSEELKQEVSTAQNGKCYLCTKPIVDYHHCLPNTEVNRKLFPAFLNSPFNCRGLCRHCHEQRKAELKISENEAAMYELYLTGKHKEYYEQGMEVS